MHLRASIKRGASGTKCHLLTSICSGVRPMPSLSKQREGHRDKVARCGARHSRCISRLLALCEENSVFTLADTHPNELW